MNIGVLTSSLDVGIAGGVANVVINLTNALAFKNTNINIYSTSNFSKNIHGVVNEAIKIHLFDAFDPFKYGYSPSLKKAILNSSSDLIHSHGIWEYTSLICNEFLKKRQKPFIVSSHGMLEPWALNNSHIKKKFFYHLMDKKYLSNASAIQVLNNNEADSLTKLGIRTPVHIIPNGVDITSEKFSYPQKWIEYFGERKKILLYLGRLHPKKSIQELILAFSEIHKNRRSEIGDWRLVLNGWGKDNYVNNIKTLIKTENLDNYIFFGGPVFNSEKLKVLQNADAFILPSKSEGYSIAVLEAWANKLPVFITEECNMNFGFEKNAAIKIHYNLEKLKNELIALFNFSSVHLKEIGNNGYTLVKNEYNWEKISDKYIELYKSILDK